MATSEIVSPNSAHDNPPVFSQHPVDSTNYGIDDSAFLAQIERILKSKELRSSGVLQRLLKFLAEKYVSDSTQDLKEYSVAIEALGKPTSYDPRHSSAVRILVGRLRQKLANYYQQEGQNDPILIDLPKGQFKLTCELREGAIKGSRQSGHVMERPDAPVPEPLIAKGVSGASRPLKAAAWMALGIGIAIACETVVHHLQSDKAKAAGISAAANLDPAVEQLWKPFIATNRPLIVAVGSPLFIALDVKKGIYYRDKELNTWDQAVSSPKVAALHALLKSTDDIEPIHYYTAYGEMEASFMIAKLLGSRVSNLTVVRATELSMQEVADNNVVFVGSQNRYFNDQIQATPIEPPLQPDADGIRDIHPGTNEPALYADHYSEAPSEDGYAYALVTHLPGPLGNNDVESFTCSRVAGYLAAVKAVTDPGFVGPLVEKLKQAGNGQMPRYYQVLLKVKFKAEVPTEITYVLSRELDYKLKK